ncbi:hypothetical protein [Escherichia coli]|uniref:hypothetical protein n=1 Tax=Escherichia coli TaxID=562 RepID=UPI001ABBF1C2|nr:hypothetical protein [Escherichia coli]MCY6514406.1 hypothetical protein [Escherichia coli]MCY6742987.1 hypothetical protein [Escherichia coli]
MKDRGMIFNEYQVRALLDGSMTQVRKIMKVQPDEDGLAKVTDGPWVDTSERIYRCPFGDVGDRLYVREPFSRLDSFNFFDPEVPHEVPDFWYWADGEPAWGDWTRPQSGAVMPCNASRITLEVTGVRVERLQSADESNLLNDLGDMLENFDTVAGRAFNHAEHYAIAGVPVGLCPEMHGFKAWWDKANGAGSFDSNPWVWVIEFKRIEGGEA